MRVFSTILLVAALVIFVFNGFLLYLILHSTSMTEPWGTGPSRTKRIYEYDNTYYDNPTTTVYDTKTKQKFLITTDGEKSQVRRILPVRDKLDWKSWVGEKYWPYQNQEKRIPDSMNGCLGARKKGGMGRGIRNTAKYTATEEEIIAGTAKYHIDNRLGDAPDNPILINGNELIVNFDPSILSRDCNMNYPKSKIQGGVLKLFGDCLFPPDSEENPTFVFVTYEEKDKNSERLRSFFVDELKLIGPDNFFHYTPADAEPWFVAANLGAVKYSGGFDYWHWRYYFISLVLRKFPYATSTIVFFVRADVKLPSNPEEMGNFLRKKMGLKHDIDIPSESGGIEYDIFSIERFKELKYKESDHRWPFLMFRNTFMSRLFLGYALRYHLYSEKRC